jgi:hypothetical protein
MAREPQRGTIGKTPQADNRFRGGTGVPATKHELRYWLAVLTLLALSRRGNRSGSLAGVISVGW